MRHPPELDTVYRPATFSDDEYGDLLEELRRIGRFELRDYEIYRVNTRLNPDALSDPVFTLAEFTDDEFENLIPALNRIGRFELRDWKLYRMNAQHAPHFFAKTRLCKALDRAIEAAGLALEAGTEGSVRFRNGFSPDPDILVVRLSGAQKAIPGDDIALIAEVSDTSHSDDLGWKRGAYAEAGLQEYWVADLKARVIYLFAEPQDGAFTRASQAAFGEKVASLTIPDLVADTSKLISL